MSRNLFKPAKMASALFILGALFSSIPLLAQDNAGSDSSQAEDAAIRETSSLTRGMSQGIAVDGQGNVVTNSDGSVKSGQFNSGNSDNSSALVQDITGVSGYLSAGNPADKKGAANVRTTLSGHVDFACGLSSGTVREAASIAVKFSGCHVVNGTITEVGLQICTDMVNGGICDAEDFSSPQFYPANQYSTIGETQVGIGCNDANRSCRISLSNEFKLKGTGSELQKQAQEKQGAQETRALLGGIVQSDTYKDAKVEQQAVADCYENSQSTYAANGTVQTCDGKQTVGGTSSSGESSSGAVCTTEQVCVDEQSNTTHFQKTCLRSFPVTTTQCTVSVKTKECTVTVDVASGAETSSCSADEIKDGSEVSSTEKCTHYDESITDESGAPNGDVSERPCLEKSRTVYYVFTEDFDTKDCAAPIDAKSCSLRSVDRELLTCPSDSWFGRTLPDDECTESISDDEGNTVIRALDYRSKSGCGYCASAARIGFTCQGTGASEMDVQGSCAYEEATNGLQGCSLVGVTAESEVAGLTVSQRETYACARTSSSCSAWREVNHCPGGNIPAGNTSSDITHGVSSEITASETDSSGSFQQAVTSAATVKAVKEGTVCTEEDRARGACGISAADISLFKGEDMRCEKPSGSLSGLANNDCCKLGLKKTGGDKLANKCSDDEVKLAAARRNKVVVSIGSYCSKKAGLFNTCIKRTETYCAFSGMLPRIVQEQGRPQLAQFAQQGVGAHFQKYPFSFQYYSAAGGWSSPVEMNGQQVSVFQQPSYCTDPQKEAAALAANPSALDCQSSVGIWFAVCTGGQCGDLPRVPETGSAKWQLTLVDPLRTSQTSLSQRVLAKGACDTETAQCNYEVSTWPAGVAGKAVLTRDLSFELYESQAEGESSQSVMIGDALLRVTPSSKPMGEGAIPTTLSAGLSNDGGNVWTNFSIPTSIGDDFQVPGTEIHASGGCSAIGLCEFRFTALLEVQAKPWGDAKHPDCSGFTLGQFSILDLSKMDLSEWTNAVAAKTPSASELAQTSAANAATAQQQAAIGGVDTPAQQPYITVTPTEGIGPFTVTLNVPTALPSGDPILGVQVDWGDRAIASKEIVSQSQRTAIFSADHRYNSPESAGMADRNGTAGPGHGRTLEHVVTITIDTQKSGTLTKSVVVRNLF